MSVAIMLTHLEELLAIHQDLLVISAEKQEALIHNKVNELAAYVNKEIRLVKRVAEIEKRWSSAVASFIADKGIKPEANITVSDIVKLIDLEADRKKLLGLQSSLLGTIDQIKQKNTLNQELIEQSLAYINYSLDLYTGDFAQDAVYQNPVESAKRNTGRKGKAWFDARA